MQGGILAILLAGILTANYTWIPAAALSLFVTEIPALLSKNLNIVLPVEMSFFIVLALFLHVIGGFAGFYDNVSWWDHLTHALSASLVGALGFVLVVSIDWYVDSIHLPGPFLAFFIAMFTMSVGVIWELMEWVTDELTGSFLQYSLDDSMLDLFFDGFAGVIVAVATTHYLAKHSSPAEMMRSMKLDQAKEKISGIIEKRKVKKEEGG